MRILIKRKGKLFSFFAFLFPVDERENRSKRRIDGGKDKEKEAYLDWIDALSEGGVPEEWIVDMMKNGVWGRVKDYWINKRIYKILKKMDKEQEEEIKKLEDEEIEEEEEEELLAPVSKKDPKIFDI